MSFTIDTDVLGKDEWIVEGCEYNDNEKQLVLTIKQLSNLKKFISNVEKKQNEKDTYTYNNNTIKVEQCGTKKKVTFIVSEDEKKKRIKNILTAIKDGLYAQSSGEANTIVPLFLIAGFVKVPSPVFHPYIDLLREDGKIKVIGITDCLKNSWLVEGDRVYLYHAERFEVPEELKVKVTYNWDDIINKFDDKPSQNQSSNANQGNKNKG